MDADAIPTTPWQSFRIRRARPDAKQIIGSYGGHPRGIRGHQWPRCAVCNAPMCHMAQIDAGPWLDLGGFARITAFICHATGGRCEDWDPFKGSNRVVLQRLKDDNLYDGPPTVRVYRRVRLTVDPPLDERVVYDDLAHGRVDPTAHRALERDKLGGAPTWLHGDDTLHSAAGDGPMRFLGQITTEIVAFDITRGGRAFLFLDPWSSSEEAAYMLWQGS